jgi:hypothetical protein
LIADTSQRFACLRAYLVEPRCAVPTTLARDGSPHQAVVHYQLEDDAILINADDPLHWVGIKGAAELVRKGATAVEDAMAIARRYSEDRERSTSTQTEKGGVR